METINIYPLECTHAPQGANTFIGGRYYDQALRDSEIVKSRTKPAEHRRQLRRLQENSNRVLKKAKKINISWSLDANDTDAVLAEKLFPSADKPVFPNKRLPDFAYIYKALLRNGINTNTVINAILTSKSVEKNS